MTSQKSNVVRYSPKADIAWTRGGPGDWRNWTTKRACHGCVWLQWFLGSACGSANPHAGSCPIYCHRNCHRTAKYWSGL